MGEGGERGDAADAVEKGELTPVKWLIKVWWSPFWGGPRGERRQEKFNTLFGKRSPAPVTSLKTGDTFIRCIYRTRTRRRHETLPTDALIFFSKAEKHAGLFFTVSWIMSGTRSELGVGGA